MSTITCTTCKKTKPRDQYYKADRKRKLCINCARLSTNGPFMCHRCHRLRPATEFPTSLKFLNGRSETCKPCRKEIDRNRAIRMNKLRRKQRLEEELAAPVGDPQLKLRMSGSKALPWQLFDREELLGSFVTREQALKLIPTIYDYITTPEIEEAPRRPSFMLSMSPGAVSKRAERARRGRAA